MMNNRGHCHNCNCEHAVSDQHVGKIAGVPIGAAIGKFADRSPWAPVIGAVIGGIVGEIADRTILPKCPTCGAALELIGTALK